METLNIFCTADSVRHFFFILLSYRLRLLCLPSAPPSKCWNSTIKRPNSLLFLFAPTRNPATWLQDFVAKVWKFKEQGRKGASFMYISFCNTI